MNELTRDDFTAIDQSIVSVPYGPRVTRKRGAPVKTLVMQALAIAIGVMALAAPAAATDITVTNVALPYSETVTLSGGMAGVAGNHLAGQIVLTTSIGTIGTWCVDLFHTINLGPTNLTYTVIELTSANNGTTPSSSTPLSSTQIQQIESLAAYGNAQLPSQSNKNAFAAAVQAAIWNVEYGSTASGSAAFATALAAIMALLPGLPLADGVQLANFSDAGVLWHQSFDYPVPEPMTMFLGGTGLLALGFLARKRLFSMGKSATV